MGCVANASDSDSEKSGRAAPKYSCRSPIVENLSEKDKQKLSALIQKDDLLGLAVAMSELKALPNSQISDSKMRWMLTHLCCRWDADNCLEFLLKDYFCQHPISYINFVNAPTIEGYTCLHLCALWQSQKCFYVIHNYGGLSLNAKDKRKKTPYETACEYKCNKMRDTLQIYRGLYVNFTQIQTQRLISKQLIAEDIQGQMKMKETQKKTIQEANKIANNADKVLNNLSQLQKQMIIQKQKLQKQKQQILQSKLKNQMDAAQQKKKILENKKLQQFQKLQYERKMKDQINQKLKLEQQKLTADLKAKQDQLNRVKNDLKKAEQQRIQKQKDQAQKKAQQFIRQKQQQLDKKMKQKEEALISLKKQEQQRTKRQKQQADKKLKQIEIAYATKEEELNRKLKQKQNQIEKIKKDEQERIKKQKQSAQKQTQQVINQSVIQYSKKLKEKQDEVKKLKQLEVQRLRRQKQQAERKALEQAKEQIKNQNNQQTQNQTQNQNQSQTQNQNQSQNKIILPPLQQTGKNTNPIASAGNQLKQAFKKINQQVPPEILKLYTEAKTVGIFFDHEFPANNQSMGDPSKSNFASLTTNTVWLRPKEFIKNDFQLFNGIEPNDIKQGSLGVCYMLATLSVLAEIPQHIQRMFIFSNISIGFYVLKFFINGKPKFVIVDDLIPCNKTTKSPLFTKPIGNQIWVLLVQKAWAKNCGDYLSAEAMTPDHMMQDLSSAPSFGSWFQKQGTKPNTQHIKTLVKHSQLQQIVVITSGQKKIEGIANNHAYSMLETYQVNGRCLFKVRNPWGQFQWNGQYNDKSSLWTPELKRKVGFEDRDDGVFFLTENQLTQAYVYYSICQISDQNFYSYSQFTSKKNQDLFYKIKITKPGSINIRVTQLFDRMLRDKAYKYSPLVFEIGKILSTKNVTFIAQGHQKSYFGAKSVHAFDNISENLEAGQYFIRIRMLWQNQSKYNTAVLAGYGPQVLKFQKLSTQQGINYLKGLLFSQGQPTKRTATGDAFYKICTMKGQFVFIGETDKDAKYKVTFKFNKNAMQMAELDYGKTNDSEIVLTVSKGEPGVGTAMRTDPSKGGTTGPVSILVQKL